MIKRLLIAGAGLLLVACSSPGLMPDYRYFRLADPVLPAAQAPIFDLPLVVERFRGSGVHGERSILYSIDGSEMKLAQYHYQLWDDPPPQLVQKFVAAHLRAAHIAPLVTERLSPREPALRLTAIIENLERVKHGDGYRVVVGLSIRLEKDGVALPLLERTYKEQAEASSDTLEASVVEMTHVLDMIAGKLTADLRTLPTAVASRSGKP
jgi:uncharacterized lipoprotein YmbA